MPEAEIALSELADRLEEVLEATNGTTVLRRLVLEAAVSGQLSVHLLEEEPSQASAAPLSKVKNAGVLPRRRRTPAKTQHAPAEETPDLPDGWEWVALGDVVESLDAHRVPLSRVEREKRVGGFDYYGASGVIDHIDDYIFDGPLLLVGEDGANLKSRSTPIAFIATGQYWVNNHAHVLDAPSLHTLRYLAVALNATNLEPYVTGTAQPKLNQAKLNRILVPMPPLAEQRLIADFVDGLFSLLDRADVDFKEAKKSRLEFANAALASLGRRIDEAVVASLIDLVQEPADVRTLEQAFIALAAEGRFTSADDASESAAEFGVFHKAELTGVLGAHPSWQRRNLGSVASILNGFAFPSARFSDKNGTPLIRIRDIFKKDTHVKFDGDYDDKYIVGEGDILIGMDGNFNVARWRGPAALLNQRVCKLILDESALLPKFVMYLLPGYLRAIHDETSSTTVTHLSSKTIATVPFPVPSLEEQRRIVEILDSLTMLTAAAINVLGPTGRR